LGGGVSGSPPQHPQRGELGQRLTLLGADFDKPTIDYVCHASCTVTSRAKNKSNNDVRALVASWR
jgi:hypothetical protein